MARKPNNKTVRKSEDQSLAHKAADAFDRNVAKARADLSKPAHESTLKQVGAVGLVAGAGFALGAWLT